MQYSKIEEERQYKELVARMFIDERKTYNDVIAQLTQQGKNAVDAAEITNKVLINISDDMVRKQKKTANDVRLMLDNLGVNTQSISSILITVFIPIAGDIFNKGGYPDDVRNSLIQKGLNADEVNEIVRQTSGEEEDEKQRLAALEEGKKDATKDLLQGVLLLFGGIIASIIFYKIGYIVLIPLAAVLAGLILLIKGLYYKFK